MDPSAIRPTILDCQKVTALPPPIVPANRQEATAQPPPIVPEPPQIGEPSPKSTMPTLVPLPASGITPAVLNGRYPEQSKRSPSFTPPKLINASSLGKGHDMTPLDVHSPAGATLEQVLYAEKNIGEDNALHNLWNIDIDLKDGYYHDRSNDDADDYVSQSSAMEAGGRGLVGI